MVNGSLSSNMQKSNPTPSVFQNSKDSNIENPWLKMGHPSSMYEYGHHYGYYHVPNYNIHQVVNTAPRFESYGPVYRPVAAELRKTYTPRFTNTSLVEDHKEESYLTAFDWQNWKKLRCEHTRTSISYAVKSTSHAIISGYSTLLNCPKPCIRPATHESPAKYLLGVIFFREESIKRMPGVCMSFGVEANYKNKTMCVSFLPIIQECVSKGICVIVADEIGRNKVGKLTKGYRHQCFGIVGSQSQSLPFPVRQLSQWV